jgi:ATP-dependent DNA helicase RecQ
MNVDIDPIADAVQKLFGLPYLFPYQRLVVANIIEAAEAAGIDIAWPSETGAGDSAGPGEPFGSDGVLADDPSGAGGMTAAGDDSVIDGPVDDEDRFSQGRQIVILPTGAGKSLCFQLPAMLMKGATLVIYPILSLMADQERRLAEKDFAPVMLRGGQSAAERAGIWEKLRTGEARFIIANPEVLLTEKVMEKLPDLGIVHVVIDEAHCVSEWGESFRPSYLRIGEIIDAIAGKRRGTQQTDGQDGLSGGRLPSDNLPRDGFSGGKETRLPLGNLPLVTAFTATASAPVLEKISRYIFGGEGESLSGATDFGNGARDGGAAHRVIGNPDRPNIAYSATGCILRNAAVRDLIRQNERPAIVFCSSRPGTERLARYLRNELNDREIRFYHAGLSREEKAAVEKWYLRNPVGILVATCAFGMGVDKADIRTVIHRDCPPSVEAYLQESGRAGRDGQPSKAVLLWGPEDEQSLKRARSEADRTRLRQLFRYAQSASPCRRAQLLGLLNYEGETAAPESDCCDVCNKTAKTSLREEKLLGFFKKHKRCYTVIEAAILLSEIESLDWTEADAKQAIRILIQQGKLVESRNILWKHKITTVVSKRD